ncbi:SDR family NAD(P)-dependent oxidoreductase [Marinospirillum alkaliphilum]|uniref:Short-chain dehydrogenase n=1 Tax=Marinospirillum alkaliphilum DSM 21637 TaxID=1122209 RepID=A0A1K1WTP8_9GAMM|nr:SDR family NAD(P)-dependent oxidoreductase [Marinospirillum alkaliphilum]SFX40761.1 Short-chain dehydrogenase [Marinospirillum alkaliphilum DSM 21637]
MKGLQPYSRIWLTGAGSGIGEALALQLAKAGHSVVITARSEASLQALARQSERFIAAAADVTDPQALSEVATLIQARLGGLDCVILNAGTCEYLNDGRVDSALVRRVMETNFMGLVHCIDVAQPLLANSHSARLVAISSAAAYAPLPRAEAYGASKAAVSYFMETLRLDLAQQGVAVTVVYPGFVKTPLTDRNDFPMPMRVTAEAMAAAIHQGLVKGKPEIRYPKLFVGLVRCLGRLPFFIRTRLGLKMVRQKDGASHG